jgi:putative transcriptional regulator
MIRILLSKKLGELRWTQADLARATGIRPSTINEYYHEIAERINLEHFDLICEALQCELTELLVRVPNSDIRVKPRGVTRPLQKEDKGQ